jgi:hypothetical protein
MKRLILLASLGLLGAPGAFAIVGRPLTPVSYAGVARRTTRRVAYAGAAAATATAAAGATTAVRAGTLATLPPGCLQEVSAGVVYERCGGTYYRPYYQGPNLVYVPAAP